MNLPVILPTRTSDDLNSASDINALMTNIEYIVDTAIYPIGSQYIQYPSVASNTEATAFPTAQTPTELYGGTWEQLWDDEAITFYTGDETGDQTRTDGLQPDQMQGHWHEYLYGTTDGASADARVDSANQTTDTAYFAINSPISDGVNGDPRTGPSTKGKNRLFKIWIRTA